MPHDLSAPRVVVASGMAGNGVSTIADQLQQSAPAINVVDGGAQWADILEACMPGFARLLAVTSNDIVSITATYALVKLVRDRFTDAPIEVVVNRCDTRDALKTYERVQSAASHFLNETVGYGGAIPDGTPDEIAEETTDETLSMDMTMAIHDIAVRLDGELNPSNGRTLQRAAERRSI